MVVYYPTLHTILNPQKIQKTAFCQIAGGFAQFWAKIFKKFFEGSLDDLFSVEKKLFRYIQYFAQNRIFGKKLQPFFHKMAILAQN